MNAVMQLVLQECDETEGDVLKLADNLMEYGFDNVIPLSYQQLLNKRGNGRGYSRV